ncbi:unnamed protein product [Gongylonema pulchrum]|uniref:PRELI/MSF1 domain-containing protein n=1 Tax=Gongylonema pulchrum TaxID=637853 RepID=A0A183EHX5_9BILA|nr:unnamed protein product [Gongylonema pulchrum]
MIVDRFWAELFRLSVDRTQWDILHPSLLSITVLEVPSRKSGTNGKAIQFIAKSETRIVSEQILETCKFWFLHRFVISHCNEDSFAYMQIKGQRLEEVKTFSCSLFVRGKSTSKYSEGWQMLTVTVL